MKRTILLAFVLSIGTLSVSVYADTGVDCERLPVWSKSIDGYQVNLHHVFCGEAGRGNKAKGFHAMPDGKSPTTFRSAKQGSGPNSAGVYTLKTIKLEFHDQSYIKSFSSMFPKHCSFEQVTNSIVYSQRNSTGKCARPGWASCGPSSPNTGGGDRYCAGRDGKHFPIASALKGKKRINTGFPIYRR